MCRPTLAVAGDHCLPGRFDAHSVSAWSLVAAAKSRTTLRLPFLTTHFHSHATRNCMNAGLRSIKVAEAMGARGIRIEDPSDVREHLLKPSPTKVDLLWWTLQSILSPCCYRRMLLIDCEGRPNIKNPRCRCLLIEFCLLRRTSANCWLVCFT